MTEKEKQLFFALARFREPFPDPSLTAYATPAVLGHLFYNRMQGIAFGTLRENGLLDRTSREFRNSLAAASEQNIIRNESFGVCVSELADLLLAENCGAALLKGAYLCAHYPAGYRTANDADLLVLPEAVTRIGNLLTKAGFRQGHLRNGEFVPATRREIITSKMMRGETVPYLKEVNLPFLRFFEVDINFSLDYKNGDRDLLSDMLSRVSVRQENGRALPMLCDADFFLQLCAHLYKEATSLPWIEMRRDMTLYKYCDIYLLLSEMSDGRLRDVFRRAEELGMEKILAFAILDTADLFGGGVPLSACNMAAAALTDDPDFRLRVVSPGEGKTLYYRTRDIGRRFFGSRIRDLTEEPFYGKT